MSAKSLSSSLAKAASLSSSSLSSLASVSSKSAASSSSSLSKAAASSLSSASSLASKSSLSAARAASTALSTASASASAYVDSSSSSSSHEGGTSYVTWGLSIFGILVALLAVVLGGLYVSGEGEHLLEGYAKKFFKAKAKAEVTALEHVGEGQAEGFLKDQLKKNPVLGEGELNQIAPGLGQEAAREGLGGVSKELGGIGGIGNLKKL